MYLLYDRLCALFNLQQPSVVLLDSAKPSDSKTATGHTGPHDACRAMRQGLPCCGAMPSAPFLRESVQQSTGQGRQELTGQVQDSSKPPAPQSPNSLVITL